METEATPFGCSVSLTVAVALLYVTVIMAISCLPTAEVMALNKTLVEFAGTVMLAGVMGDIFTSFVLLVTDTLAPLFGADPLNVTLPIS